MFLRGLVEQRDRDAAELRAALREALKMSNRALPAVSANAGTESALQAPQLAQIPPAGNQQATAKSGQQRPAERDARPLWARLLGYRPKW